MKKVLIIAIICLFVGVLSSCSGGKKCPAYSDNSEIENIDPNF